MPRGKGKLREVKITEENLDHRIGKITAVNGNNVDVLCDTRDETATEVIRTKCVIRGSIKHSKGTKLQKDLIVLVELHEAKSGESFRTGELQYIYGPSESATFQKVALLLSDGDNLVSEWFYNFISGRTTGVGGARSIRRVTSESSAGSTPIGRVFSEGDQTIIKKENYDFLNQFTSPSRTSERTASSLKKSPTEGEWEVEYDEEDEGVTSPSVFHGAAGGGGGGLKRVGPEEDDAEHEIDVSKI